MTGIAVKVSARTASPVGTATFYFRNDTDAADGDALVINVTDVHASGLGWIFLKFASDRTPDGADTFKIGFKCSTNAELTLYRDGTAGNWSRQVAGPAGSAPATDDIIIIVGEHTGAGTGNDLTVTNDQTNISVVSVSTAAHIRGFTVNRRGILSQNTGAGTFEIKHKGIFECWGGGTVNIGTSGSRVTGTLLWTADSASAGDSRWRFNSGCTVTGYGTNITDRSTVLNTDEAAAQTVLGIATINGFGWASTPRSGINNIAIASTSRTYSEFEGRITSVVADTSLTVTAGLTNAHSGTFPTAAEVIYLYSNVVFSGASTTLSGSMWFSGTVSANFDNAEFQFLGVNVSEQWGIHIRPTTGTVAFNICSFHDFTVDGAMAFRATSASSTGTLSLNNSVFYNIDAVAVYGDAPNGFTYSMTGNTFLGQQRNSGDKAVQFYSSTAITFNTNVITSWSGDGFFYNIVGRYDFTGNTSHSNAGHCFYISGGAFSTITPSTFNNNTAYRCANSHGLALIWNIQQSVSMSNFTSFGNVGAGIYINQTGGWLDLIIAGSTFAGDSSFAQPSGILNQPASLPIFAQIYNTTFGVATGIFVAHSSRDILIDPPTVAQYTLDDVNLASSTQVANLPLTSQPRETFVRAERIASDGIHKTWLPNGTISSDTVIFNTASPSSRLTPTSATFKLESGETDVITADTSTVTFSVSARKSAVGDGAAYNGNQPRLIVKRNYAMGITADTVLDTMTVGTGTWETLTGTTAAVTSDGTLEFIVDLDGTAGWVNIDDITVTRSVNPDGCPGLKYDKKGRPVPSSAPGNGCGTVAGGGTGWFGIKN